MRSHGGGSTFPEYFPPKCQNGILINKCIGRWQSHPSIPPYLGTFNGQPLFLRAASQYDRHAHMSVPPPLGHAEGNGIHPAFDGGPPPSAKGGGADHPPHVRRDGLASTSHFEKKLNIKSKRKSPPLDVRFLNYF